MPPAPGKKTQDARRPITITAVIDAVGALADGNMRDHLYLYDTNMTPDSIGVGTGQLVTRAEQGDQLLWNAHPLECEAFVAIDDILIDRTICEPVEQVYPGTDITYWTATVNKTSAEPVPYQIKFKLGSRTEPITTILSPALVTT